MRKTLCRTWNMARNSENMKNTQSRILDFVEKIDKHRK